MKRALKAQLRPQWLETMKLYIHTHQRQTRYIDSPKNTLYTDIYDILNFLISLKKLLHTNFGIGDIVTGTTPITTLRELLFYVCKNSDKDSAPSGRTYRTDDLHIIKICLQNSLIYK